ncbi:hypothetical protein Bca52824_032454 [Brassica carinata]|uniref:Uncharacterized protein n=1 Tax=Brassica carinata TaxID=52824 RepID=A0A8X7SA88_BRACI|nr:hypothetical protein Bca52824_032454 [Brassica carinata]
MAPTTGKTAAVITNNSGKEENRYRGVRKRPWGPAAHASDKASVSFRRAKAKTNFPRPFMVDNESPNQSSTVGSSSTITNPNLETRFPFPKIQSEASSVVMDRSPEKPSRVPLDFDLNFPPKPENY